MFAERIPEPVELATDRLDVRLSGAVLIDLPERYQQSGVYGIIVNNVKAGSRADNNGLEVGDRIMVINRQNIRDLNALRASLSPPPIKLELGLARGRQSGYLQMR